MLTKVRTWAKDTTEQPWFERLVIGAILINSIVLGMETYRPLYEVHRSLFTLIDTAFLCFFVGEIALRIVAQGWRFFRGGWNWFDFAIVVSSLLPMLGNVSALRALRILRALRLLSAIPVFKEITESLVRAASGALAIFGMLGLLLYVFAVMSSKLFGVMHPDLFGNLEISLLTHVQLMIFDGWRDVVDVVVATHGFAIFWYFLAYSLIVGFVLVSMLVGVIVESKQQVTNEELLAEIRGLKDEIESLKAAK